MNQEVDRLRQTLTNNNVDMTGTNGLADYLHTQGWKAVYIERHRRLVPVKFTDDGSLAPVYNAHGENEGTSPYYHHLFLQKHLKPDLISYGISKLPDKLKRWAGHTPQPISTIPPAYR